MQKEHPNKIRNGRIRRDFKRLLEIIAESSEPSASALAETVEIAERHALYFDDRGNVKEAE